MDDQTWQRLGDAGVPEGIRAVATWPHERLVRGYADSDNGDFIKSFLANRETAIKKGAGLTFLGGSGTGKTVAATWLFCHLVMAGLPGVWTREWHVLEAILNKHETDEGDLVRERLVQAPLLLLDGVKDPAKNRMTHLTWELLADREVGRTVNLVTLQFDPTEVKETDVLKRLGVAVNLEDNPDFGAKRQRQMSGWVRNGN